MGRVFVWMIISFFNTECQPGEEGPKSHTSDEEGEDTDDDEELLVGPTVRAEGPGAAFA